ncbi:MAG: hypothetical protein L3J53_08200 [Proteobacteria bacterium]|nr:hypothetical protein [Pseudomonadota bacterium]
MQPSNLKLTNKAQGLARAKMLIKTHLYWLNGFPVYENGQLFWQCPFSSRANNPIQITVTMVSKAQRTVNELFKDFPITLPKIVGDSKLWFARCHEYLDYYKLLEQGHNHAKPLSLFLQNRAYQEKFARYLTDKEPELITALSWLHYIDRKPLKNSLKFLTIYANKINTHNLSTQGYLYLIHLYAQESKRADGLINLIFHTMSINVCMEIGEHHLDNHINAKMPKLKRKLITQKAILTRVTLPEVHNNQALLDLLQWVIRTKPTQRKRALILINSFDLSTLIMQWFNWWSKIDGYCLKIENLINYADKLKIKQLQTLQKKLKNLKKNKPDNLDILSTVAAIKSLSQHKDLSQALQKLFASIPKSIPENKYNYPARIKFLNYFHMICVYDAIKTTELPKYILLLAKYIKSHPKCYKNAPWQKLAEYYWGTLEASIFDVLKPIDFARFFKILTAIQQQTALTHSDAEEVITIVAAKFSDERTISLSLYLLEHSCIDYIAKIVIKIIKHYDLNNQQVLQTIKIWKKFNEEFTDDDTLKVMFDLFIEIDAADIFKQLLFLGYGNKLRQDCYQVRTIKKLAGIRQVPIFKQTHKHSETWIKNYPPIFHATLQQLNAVSTKAEKKAHKIFLANWWTQSMLKSQIATVEAQLLQLVKEQQNKLLPRLENLNNKLKDHKAITTIEQDKIQTKLDTLIIVEQYNSWQQRLFTSFKVQWIKFFGLDNNQVPEWFFISEVIYKMMPIIDFATKDKQLAIKVIQNRCLFKNCKDWQFINDSKNQQFITKLNDLGFNMEIWINGIADKIYRAENSQNITIAIAQDPLEILNMGAYFKTCLSPTSFNYFSVFANIADINKKVIYAKNSQGKVIGRVLVGITDIGGLMIYHMYYHNAQDSFKKFAHEYIQDWAMQIGLTLTNSGKVATLLATNWYDDDAINVDNGIQSYKPNSDFRKSLSNLKAEQFTQVLKQNLAPLKINSMTFSLLLNLPELPKNKELFPVLIDIAQQTKYLTSETKIQLYKLSHIMGFKHYYSYFRNTIINYQNKKLKNDKSIDVDIGLLMAENNPSDALTIIKKYGRIFAKKWHANLKGNSHEIAIKALNNLGRTQKAQEIELFYQKNSKKNTNN